MRNLKSTLAIVMFTVFLGCEKSDEPIGLVNKWQLSETLFDPGDGSGVFNPVESNSTIVFLEDGSFSTDAFGCQLFQEGVESTGEYNLDEMILTFSDCDFSHSFELDDNNLIVDLLCIEPCRLKFKLVD